MPKSFFQFKQFIIHQDKCAMKVCTDACILGGYASTDNIEKILDIGTGTGLLSLMLAQRSDAHIDAVEIDAEAFRQASENIAGSPFAHRINLHLLSIQQFSEDAPNKPQQCYDLIVSNPPFYQNSLPSPDRQTNMALHAATLTLGELVDAVDNLLKPEGRFVVLLPPFEAGQLVEAAQQKSLHLVDTLLIQHDSDKPVFRHILTFAKTLVSSGTEDTLMIFGSSGTYSDKFRALLSEYYTIF